MHFSTLSTFLPLLAASSLAVPLNNTQTPNIKWLPCDASLERIKTASGYNGTINCANLTVPLDYTNPSSNATIELNLLHVPLQKGQSKGTVQLNFGGPGLEARMTLAESIEIYQG